MSTSEQPAAPPQECRLVIVAGEEGAGKSTIVRRTTRPKRTTQEWRDMVDGSRKI